MSTYYFIVCRRCREYIDFVAVWFPARWEWMIDAVERVPRFIARHSDHVEELIIVDEHDSILDECREFGEEEERVMA